MDWQVASISIGAVAGVIVAALVGAAVEWMAAAIRRARAQGAAINWIGADEP